MRKLRPNRLDKLPRTIESGLAFFAVISNQESFSHCLHKALLLRTACSKCFNFWRDLCKSIQTLMPCHNHNDASALTKVRFLFPAWSSTVKTLPLSPGNHQYQPQIMTLFISLPELSFLLILEVSY